MLEENEKLARARLAAVEVFQQQIADDAKVLRAHKLQSARKVISDRFCWKYMYLLTQYKRKIMLLVATVQF